MKTVKLAASRKSNNNAKAIAFTEVLSEANQKNVDLKESIEWIRAIKMDNIRTVGVGFLDGKLVFAKTHFDQSPDVYELKLGEAAQKLKDIYTAEILMSPDIEVSDEGMIRFLNLVITEA